MCTNGQRLPLSEYRQCNWGIVPSHALVTSSARTAKERIRYQQFIAKNVNFYSTHPIVNATNLNDRRFDGFNRFDNNNNDDKYYNRNPNLNFEGNNEPNPYANNNNRFDNGRGFSNLDNSFSTERNYYDPNRDANRDPTRDVGLQNETQLYEKFDLFESKRYDGRLNLMFQDAARNLIPIRENDQSFAGYLGQSLQQIMEIRHCPVGRMSLCITSDAEHDKCVKMRVFFFFDS